MTDRLIRGLFAEQNIRFAVCESTALCNEGVRRHQPDHLAAWLLSEALTCAVLLSMDLKAREKITLRWIYDGPIGEILADTTPEAEVRGFPQRLHVLGKANSIAEAIGSDGRITAVTSLPNRVVHTGITPVVFRDVARDMAHLLSLSFQVESAMCVGLIVPLAEPIVVRSAMGILLQPLPNGDLEVFEGMRQMLEQDAFREWLEAEPRPVEAVLERVAGGSPYEVLHTREPRFACSCSRGKVESVLRMLDTDELRQMLDEDGYVEVQCHFCGEAYHFEEPEVRQFLREAASGHA